MSVELAPERAGEGKERGRLRERSITEGSGGSEESHPERWH